MKLGVLALAVASILSGLAIAERAPPTKLQIGVLYRPESCPQRAQAGNTVSVHYTGTLFSDGTEFDSSVKRGTPLSFTLGEGRVIKGWDQGILNMCVGEKRKLKIPADLAYGSRGAPPVIPPDAALVFETELVGISPAHEEL
ncbi:Peptidyl-prolyl cis-trans isomerase fpr2 [Coemansia sp. RSA 552]|nr:Peptidyl-prolyl cis-trans isomerase fpr2 [Coemansia sp. RSA 552]